MSFFGFEQGDLNKEKQKFLEGGLHETEDVAVYTWGEESYDGLGDALQEGGDDLNDETFGAGPVGKDFDFGNPALPVPQNQAEQAFNQQRSEAQFSPFDSQKNTAPKQNLESLWDDKSPFSVLPRSNGAGRQDLSSRHPTYEPPTSNHQPMSRGIGQSGGRTLQEIEEEMRAVAHQSRAAVAPRHEPIHPSDEDYMNQLQEQDLHRQQLLFQQEQQLHLQRLQQQQLLQQRGEYQHQRTPPPRMLPVSQSPRFLEHQRQILLLQQQQEQQQSLRLQELQEQLRMEGLERQMRAQQISQLDQGPNHFGHVRQHSGPKYSDAYASQMLHEQDERRSQSPARGSQFRVPLQDSMQYLPQSIQLQQQLLNDLAQAELMLGGGSPADQEALRVEAMRKIVEAERMEERRRRKAAKIAHMARYNDLMTQSDKDFITRIQVSQLVTQDPYADDFYAQVYGAILRSRLGLSSQDERVLKFGSGGGVGLGLAQKGGNRRPNAMQRMEQQVERIVSNARRRDEEKGLHSLHSLHGALGKTSGRSYKAAPRQLLQVDANNPTTSPTLAHTRAHSHGQDDVTSSPQNAAAAQAAKLGREALGRAADATNLVRSEPLSQRQVLISLENLYDLVLKVEQLRRDQPLPEDEEIFMEWQTEYDELVDQIWNEMKVMAPLEISNPHPFISLLSASKGKKVLPRLTRHLDADRLLIMLTLLIACFSQLDVVTQAPLLDFLEDSSQRSDLERQTQAFMGSVTQSILPTVVKVDLHHITSLLGLLIFKNDIATVAQTRPGLALLTMFLTRVAVITQSVNITDPADLPTVEQATQWQMMFDHLFHLLSPELPLLFPSVRILAHRPNAHPNLATDVMDQPVWQFFAAFAVHASNEQRQILVTALRAKILENIVAAKKYVDDEDERRTKLANVDIFLHAIDLDSSQIAM